MSEGKVDVSLEFSCFFYDLVDIANLIYITSWEIDGETVETASDFIFLGSKITADGDCSHEIKGHLLLGKKAVTNSILENRDTMWKILQEIGISTTLPAF